MKKHSVAVFFAIMFLFASSGLSAEKKMHACSLLTSGEIAGAVGGQAGPFQENDIVIPGGPSKGKTMGVCMWRIDGDQGMVSVNIIPLPKGPQRAEGMAKLSQAFDRLKAKGWTEEKKEFGNTKCVIMTEATKEKPPRINPGGFELEHKEKALL